LLSWYKSTNTDAPAAGGYCACMLSSIRNAGTQVPCFTGTKGQVLTVCKLSAIRNAVLADRAVRQGGNLSGEALAASYKTCADRAQASSIAGASYRC
jgi:hypothetical protein